MKRRGFLARLVGTDSVACHCSVLLLDNICTSLSISIIAICIFILKYDVQQFSYGNGPVEANFACLFTSGCRRFRNIPFVKLCTFRDDGPTAGSSLDNCFLQHPAVTFSRCVGCQECQQIFIPPGHFLILEKAKKKKSQVAESGE
jgi:hypothetical protein